MGFTATNLAKILDQPKQRQQLCDLFLVDIPSDARWFASQSHKGREEFARATVIDVFPLLRRCGSTFSKWATPAAAATAAAASNSNVIQSTLPDRYERAVRTLGVQSVSSPPQSLFRFMWQLLRPFATNASSQLRICRQCGYADNSVRGGGGDSYNKERKNDDDDDDDTVDEDAGPPCRNAKMATTTTDNSNEQQQQQQHEWQHLAQHELVYIFVSEGYKRPGRKRDRVRRPSRYQPRAGTDSRRVATRFYIHSDRLIYRLEIDKRTDAVLYACLEPVLIEDLVANSATCGSVALDALQQVAAYLCLQATVPKGHLRNCRLIMDLNRKPTSKPLLRCLHDDNHELDSSLSSSSSNMNHAPISIAYDRLHSKPKVQLLEAHGHLEAEHAFSHWWDYLRHSGQFDPNMRIRFDTNDNDAWCILLLRASTFLADAADALHTIVCIKAPRRRDKQGNVIRSKRFGTQHTDCNTRYVAPVLAARQLKNNGRTCDAFVMSIITAYGNDFVRDECIHESMDIDDDDDDDDAKRDSQADITTATSEDILRLPQTKLFGYISAALIINACTLFENAAAAVSSKVQGGYVTATAAAGSSSTDVTDVMDANRTPWILRNCQRTFIPFVKTCWRMYAEKRKFIPASSTESALLSGIAERDLRYLMRKDGRVFGCKKRPGCEEYDEPQMQHIQNAIAKMFEDLRFVYMYFRGWSHDDADNDAKSSIDNYAFLVPPHIRSDRSVVGAAATTTVVTTTATAATSNTHTDRQHKKHPRPGHDEDDEDEDEETTLHKDKKQKTLALARDIIRQDVSRKNILDIIFHCTKPEHWQLLRQMRDIAIDDSRSCDDDGAVSVKQIYSTGSFCVPCEWHASIAVIIWAITRKWTTTTALLLDSGCPPNALQAFRVECFRCIWNACEECELNDGNTLDAPKRYNAIYGVVRSLLPLWQLFGTCKNVPAQTIIDALDADKHFTSLVVDPKQVALHVAQHLETLPTRDK